MINEAPMSICYSEKQIKFVTANIIVYGCSATLARLHSINYNGDKLGAQLCKVYFSVEFHPKTIMIKLTALLHFTIYTGI